MAGLNLGGGSDRWMLPQQGFVPAAAGVTPGAPTIGKRAFGVYSQQSGAPGPRTAAAGTVILGLAGAAVLAWLWWSLPR